MCVNIVSVRYRKITIDVSETFIQSLYYGVPEPRYSFIIGKHLIKYNNWCLTRTEITSKLIASVTESLSMFIKS